MESWPPKRPLYGLQELARRPDAAVVVTEGEKACDAARKLLPDVVVVTSPNGSKRGQADWSPLRGRAVTIWPDSDGPGVAYAKAVAAALKPIAASVAIFDLPDGLALGFDAADALALGWDTDRVMDLVHSAKPVSDDAKPGKGEGRRKGPPPQRDQLTELVNDAELWHDAKRTAYISVPINGHVEHWRLRSHEMRLILRHRYLTAKKGEQPGGQALEDAIGALEARAIFDGPEYEVFLRTGSHLGKNYLDLCDKDWRTIEIDVDGWRVVENPPVKFIRTNAMQALPLPDRDEDRAEDRTVTDLLKPFINTKTDADFMLVVAWLVAAMRPQGPYAILAVNGEAGTAKSSACRYLRALVDPNVVALRSLPKKIRTCGLAPTIAL